MALAGVVALRGWPLPALATGVAVVVPYHLLRFPPEVVLPALLLLRYSVAVTGSRLRAAVSGALTVVAVLLSMRLSAGGWPGGDAVDAVGWLAAAAALGQAVRHQRAHSAVLTEREPVDHQARGAGPRAAGDRSL